jgi:RHS repeat-associated protein
LTSAQERGSTTNSLTYAYDRTGNRTDGGKTYDAANQVSGWTYDAAGNLTNDGTTTYAYDALSRLTTRGAVTQAYNGDGTLVAATSGSTTTRYAQDLASPLSQVLQIGTTNYVYGMERLAAQTGSTRTWYGADALGSVRQTLDAAGVPQATTSDDPWGQVQTGSVPTFGFTGELHDGAAGLVNLRARWYNTRAGTFTAVDPFAGFAEQPYSQHPYQYAYSSPTTYTDPTGRSPIYCVPIAVLDSPIPGPADLAAGACFVVVAGVYFVGQMLSPYSSGTAVGQSSPFDTGGAPVPVLSAPHEAPQPAPTPVPFPAPTEQLRPITVFPEASDCPPVVVQPGPVALPPTPVISADPLPTPGVRGPVIYQASMSQQLDQNMQAAGVAKPPGSDAHHIVAATSPRASLARRILANAGIGVNDAINGVYLPSSQKEGIYTVGDVWHAGIHTKAYYAEVERRLLLVAPGGAPISPRAVRTVLRQIAQEIEQGVFP